MKTLDWQKWLNAHGARLVLDGKEGPATRAATIEVFRNTAAPAATTNDKAAIAARIGVTPRQLETVARVESAGGGWDTAGLLKCLWERHYLWRRIKVAVPGLSAKQSGGYTVDANGNGINDSWEKLADAASRFGFDVAAECASFGKFQVMGAHWKALGYPSVQELVWLLSRSEAAHYELLARFIEVNNLAGAMRAGGTTTGSWTAFARGYNGKGQRGYDQRMADQFRRLGA